jgi:hypothetical protein
MSFEMWFELLRCNRGRTEHDLEDEVLCILLHWYLLCTMSRALNIAFSLN